MGKLLLKMEKLLLHLEYLLIFLVLKRILAFIELSKIIEFLIIIEYRLGAFLLEAGANRNLNILIKEATIEIYHAYYLRSLHKKINPEKEIKLGNGHVSVDKKPVCYIRGGTARIKPVQRFLGCDCVELSNLDLLAMYGELEKSLYLLYKALSEISGYKEFARIAKDEKKQSFIFCEQVGFWFKLKWKLKKIKAWIQFLIYKEYEKKEIEKCLSLKLGK